MVVAWHTVTSAWVECRGEAFLGGYIKKKEREILYFMRSVVFVLVSSESYGLREVSVMSE
jgi:hypothetical protein